jgi:hypothetical protein
LPDFCAAAKASGVNGLVSAANAGATTGALAAAAVKSAVKSAERRDSMSDLPPGFMAAGSTAHRDDRRSQLSNMPSNFSHCLVSLRLR